MRVTYDQTVDAAYIYLIERIEAGSVASSYCCDPEEVDGMINLDFDGHGHLIGVEVLGASHHLAPETLAGAERLDRKAP